MNKATQDRHAALAQALKDNLTPHAIVVAIGRLVDARSNNPAVTGEVAWLADLMMETVGGHEEYNRMIDELGL